MSKADAPPPALGELARRVTMQEIEIRRDEAASHAESHEGSSDYGYHCQERDFWFNVAALVALATGGAEDTARLDWLEAHDHSAMCWNVSDSIDARHWAAPMKPNNGWSIETSDEDDSADAPRGKTLRDAIDWAKKLAARSLTPERPADAD